MATQTRNGSLKEEKQRPCWSRKFFSGSGTIEIAVWLRTIQTDSGERDVLNTSVKKTYKVKNKDDYEESGSYRPEELPLIAAALHEAFHFISEEMHRE